MTSNTPKKNYHHGNLRQSLVDEAARIIHSESEQALSMRKLAANMGVSRTAAYHHFDDKHALLCAVAEEGFKRLEAMIHNSGIDHNSAVTQASLTCFFKCYVRFAFEHSQYYDLMFGGHLWNSSKLSESLAKQAHHCFRQYVNRIRRWKAHGNISAELDPTRYAQVSWSTLHGMSRLIIDGIYLDAKAMNPICENAAHILWQALL